MFNSSLSRSINNEGNGDSFTNSYKVFRDILNPLYGYLFFIFYEELNNNVNKHTIL